MPGQDDLHPIRWRRTRPFSRSVINKVGRSCPSGTFTYDLLEQVSGEVMRGYNAHLAALPFEERPSDTRTFKKELNVALYAARFFTMGRNAFRLSGGLATALEHTSLAGVRVGDVRLPHGYFYLSVDPVDCGSLEGPDHRIDGVYLDATAEGRWQVLVTSRPPASGGKWPKDAEPHLYVPLNVDVADDPSFDDLLALAVAGGDVPIAEPSVDGPGAGDEDVDLGPVLDGEGVPVVGRVVDVRRRKDVEEAVRNRNAFPGVRKALAVLFNALAWLTAEPGEADLPGDWGPEADPAAVDDLRSPIKGRRRRAEASLLDKGLVPIRILGTNVPDPRSGFETAESGTPLAHAHWRIGHWRRQAHGTGRSLRRLVWIKPVLVRADLGADPDRGGHVYVVGP